MTQKNHRSPVIRLKVGYSRSCLFLGFNFVLDLSDFRCQIGLWQEVIKHLIGELTRIRKLRQ